MPESRVITYPPLYSGEDIPVIDKLVFERFFIGAPDDERASQWWLCEHDPVQDIAFGFVVLVGDGINSGFGYFMPMCELETLAVRTQDCDVLFVHRDLFWTPKPISEAVPRHLH